MSTAEKLIEAQIRFIMRKFEGEHLAGFLENEIGAAYDSLAGIRLSDLVSRELFGNIVLEILALIRESEGPPEAAEIIAGATADILRGAELEGIVSKEHFDELVNSLFDLQSEREKIVHLMIETEVYSRIISEIVFYAIKDFVINNNPIAKTIPGASSLLKLGGNIMKKLPGASGIEGGIEKSLNLFLKTNIIGIIEHSETIINQRFDRELPRIVKNQTWNYFRENGIPMLPESESDGRVMRLKHILLMILREFIKTPCFEETARRCAESLYDRFGAMTVSEFLARYGAGRESLVRIISDAAAPVLSNNEVRRHIESRIRIHLQEFFSSGEAEPYLR